MKIRCGFVTNSSSSSFIIARKENLDRNILFQFVLNSDSLNTIIENFEYYEKNPEIEEAYEKKDSKLKEMIAESITNRLLHYHVSILSVDMNLEDWNLVSGECSNETDDFFHFFIYDVEEINLDGFRLHIF